ncbi:hypothetical protein [Alkalitalea saponilacus]|uniref:Uncharacterized protein n=1 Tax=Alkalitalea saponilacus TaxID=889453 RepID=A0A1T5HSZ5_9BACT|nr:hypothetical protein [Alkalitalea saponilacus]SKC23757.1 hypothetical protein SAMN03080601_03042 [Alkalitalea saponilacus]
MGKIMTYEDLHFFGIKVVYKNLIDNGFEVLNVRKELDVNPQILARKKEEMYFVVVRTAAYPEMGILTPDVASKVTLHALRHKAICRFASVGVANANGETEEQMGKPETGGEFYINFNGLMPFPQ